VFGDGDFDGETAGANWERSGSHRDEVCLFQIEVFRQIGGVAIDAGRRHRFGGLRRGFSFSSLRWALGGIEAEFDDVYCNMYGYPGKTRRGGHDADDAEAFVEGVSKGVNDGLLFFREKILDGRRALYLPGGRVDAHDDVQVAVDREPPIAGLSAVGVPS